MRAVTRKVPRLASLAVTVLAAMTVLAIPASATASLVRQGVKINGEAESMEAFGHTIGLSSDGSTAVIGSPEGAGFHGAAWVYVRSGSGWTEQAELLGEPGDQGDGSAVAISGDGNTVLFSAGADRTDVFVRSGSVWAQQATLVAPTGVAVALSSDGNTALVSDSLYDSSPGSENAVGSATVFARAGSAWTKQQTLTPADEIGEGRFGESVSLSSSGDAAVVVGISDGEQNTKPFPPWPGAAWVFTRSGSTWTEQQKFTSLTEIRQAAISGSGGTVVLVGNQKWQTLSSNGSSWVPGEPQTIAAGRELSLSEDGETALASLDNVPRAQIYRRVGSTWTPEGAPLEVTGDETFGQDGGVALSADASTAMVADYGNVWAFGQETIPPGGSTGGGSTGTTSGSATVNGPVVNPGPGSTGTSPVPPNAPAKPLTRAQKLAKALKACKKQKSKSKRKTCEAQARKRYMPKAKKKEKR